MRIPTDIPTVPGSVASAAAGNRSPIPGSMLSALQLMIEDRLKKGKKSSEESAKGATPTGRANKGEAPPAGTPPSGEAAGEPTPAGGGPISGPILSALNLAWMLSKQGNATGGTGKGATPTEPAATGGAPAGTPATGGDAAGTTEGAAAGKPAKGSIPNAAVMGPFTGPLLGALLVGQKLGGQPAGKTGSSGAATGEGPTALQRAQAAAGQGEAILSGVDPNVQVPIVGKEKMDALALEVAGMNVDDLKKLGELIAKGPEKTKPSLTLERIGILAGLALAAKALGANSEDVAGFIEGFLPAVQQADKERAEEAQKEFATKVSALVSKIGAGKEVMGTIATGKEGVRLDAQAISQMMLAGAGLSLEQAKVGFDAGHLWADIYKAEFLAVDMTEDVYKGTLEGYMKDLAVASPNAIPDLVKNINTLNLARAEYLRRIGVNPALGPALISNNMMASLIKVARIKEKALNTESAATDINLRFETYKALGDLMSSFRGLIFNPDPKAQQAFVDLMGPMLKSVVDSIPFASEQERGAFIAGLLEYVEKVALLPTEKEAAFGLAGRELAIKKLGIVLGYQEAMERNRISEAAMVLSALNNQGQGPGDPEFDAKAGPAVKMAREDITKGIGEADSIAARLAGAKSGGISSSRSELTPEQLRRQLRYKLDGLWVSMDAYGDLLELTNPGMLRDDIPEYAAAKKKVEFLENVYKRGGR